MTNNNASEAKRPRNITSIVACSLISGLVSAIALVALPLAGARENVISGAVLIAFAFGWAMLALLSLGFTGQPQRWAAVPAAFFALFGVGLLAWPGVVSQEWLNWIWPVILLALVLWMTKRVRLELRSRTSRSLLYPVFAVLSIAAVGGAYETVRERMDRATYSAPGQLVDVGGRRLHIVCTGTGSPTVVLLPGFAGFSSNWGWIAPSIARTTRVCVYDRAGRGWSDDAPASQDGIAIVTDLHTLLDRANVTGPFVLAGHSLGGLEALTFAARYPEQVAGVVLLDSSHPEMFTRLRAYPLVYDVYRRVSALFPSLARLSVGRFAYRSAFDSLPSHSRDEQRAFWSTARQARSQRDEWAEIPMLMQQARSVRTLSNRPLFVLTAAREAQEGWMPLQDDFASLSSNTLHQVLPNAVHEDLTNNRRESAASSGAILDVVEAIRTNKSLAELERGRAMVLSDKAQ